MALPGEEMCRPVATCGDGVWGDIPVDDNTVYVDQGYAGGQSDGTASGPWTAIEDAVANAAPGSLIVVAAGSYGENVVIDKAVRIWGRCPELVEVHGSLVDSAAIWFVDGASGAEIHGVAVTGVGLGLGIVGMDNVTIDEVWVHDTGDAGLAVLTNASVTLRDSLIERATLAGVVEMSARLDAVGVVVRDTRPSGGRFGRRRRHPAPAQHRQE